MKILFVENHQVFATTVIRQFLSAHTVTVVPTLTAALTQLANHFDLILLDYDLDDAKGDQLLNTMRSMGLRTPVIGVSSHESGNTALLRAGAVAICSKMEFHRISETIETIGRAINDSPALDNLLWWVTPGTLAGMPMPYIHPDRRLQMGAPLAAYNDELPHIFSAGIRAVASLLNIPSDAAVYRAAGFDFICLPIPDGAPPTYEQAASFLDFANRNIAQARPVAVHCEAGIGRTGTMLATYLISCGSSAADAIRRIRQAEKSAIETSAQIHFLEEFARTFAPE